MAQMIVFEGGVTLEYSAGDTDRKILISGGEQSESLANRIARELGFPSEVEFDAMLQATWAQRASGDYVPGRTDATREGVQLRVTVEVLNPGTVPA